MPAPLNVLWLVESVALNGGTEGQIREIALRLDPKRFKLHVATFDGSVLNVPPESPICSCSFPLSRMWSLKGSAQLCRIAEYAKANNIDIVQGFMIKSSLAAVIVRILANVSVAIVSRRNLGHDHTWRTRALTRMLCRFATRIVANSEAVKSASVKSERLSRSRVDVIYNGVDLVRLSTPSRFNSQHDMTVSLPIGNPIVGIVANYRPVKDLALFLRSAALVSRARSDVHFLLVGAGSLETELKTYAAELGISQRTIFTGGKGPVDAYLKHITIGCLTSIEEGFSNAILEYMGAGIPVVATDVGGTSEAILDGKTGILVKTRDHHQFARALLSLLSDPEKARGFGEHGRAECLRRFDIASAVQTWEYYYESALTAVLERSKPRRLPKRPVLAAPRRLQV